MLETLLPFILTAFVIELTPGPNMGYLAVLSIDRGRRAGLAAVAGVALGLLLLGLAAGFGLGSIISETRWLYETLRWGGVAYLVWLAWDSYREAQKPLQDNGGERNLMGYFGRGLVSNLLNPKAAVFYIAVMPNFISADAPAGRQSLVLTLVYVAVATVVHLGIVVLASTLQPLLASERIRSRAGIGFGLVLLGIAIWLAITTHRNW
ncbi:MAG: LysE family translocator [Devosia sp.]|jgi:threonine/homoserine/homoserine lactone efflux protein|nr:LysE family translocator [Devosia sp.]